MARRIFNATQLKGFLSNFKFWPVVEKVEILKADNGQVLAELKIEKKHTDMYGNLSVGFSAFLVDTYTSSTLLTLDQIGNDSFSSIDMNVNTISNAIVGHEVVIDANMHIIEKNFAYTNCEIRNKITGRLISKGSHTLYIFRPKNSTGMCSKMTAELITKFLKESKGFNRVLEKVKVISAGDGNCVAELKISEDDCNAYGSLHGGLSATLIDTLTSLALITHKNCGIEVPNVSIDIHVNYMKSAALNEEIVINSQTLRVGKTLANLSCEIKNKSTGDLLVTGTHTKFLMRPKC